VVSEQSAQDRYVTEITVLAAQTVTPHRATGNAAGDERRTHDPQPESRNAPLNQRATMRQFCFAAFSLLLSSYGLFWGCIVDVTLGLLVFLAFVNLLLSS